MRDFDCVSVSNLQSLADKLMRDAILETNLVRSRWPEKEKSDKLGPPPSRIRSRCSERGWKLEEIEWFDTLTLCL